MTILVILGAFVIIPLIVVFAGGDKGAIDLTMGILEFLLIIYMCVSCFILN